MVLASGAQQPQAIKGSPCVRHAGNGACIYVGRADHSMPKNDLVALTSPPLITYLQRAQLLHYRVSQLPSMLAGDVRY